MHRFLIGYDLDKPGTDYSGLICDIETNFSSRRHDLDSTRVVKSELSADDIRDLLKSHIDANDRLLVIKLTDAAACKGFSDAAVRWLSSDR